MYTPVCFGTFPPLTRTKRRHAHLNIQDGAVVESVGPHLCLSRTEDGDENLGEPVRDLRRPVCGALLGEVYEDITQLVLLAAVGAIPSLVQNLYSGTLEGQSM